jgi:DNA-binding LacI/PurR family transcriptional regulator
VLIRVVSFDDSSLCEVVRPALTARARDVVAYGARAAQALIALVEGEEMPGNVDEMPRLISRGSTAPFMAAAPGDGRDALPAH